MNKSEKFTNQNELKSKTKSIIDKVMQGENYIVMRYSKPVAVLLSMEDYCHLTEDHKKDCSHCQEVIKNAISKINKTNEKNISG